MSKNELRTLADTLPPTQFLSAPEYLAALYQVLKKHFGTYSYVRFTEDLGFGTCNAMHLIIHGQRPLTLRGAAKIVAALGLKGVSRRYFLQLVRTSQVGDPTEREAAFDRLVSLKARTLPRRLDRRQLEFFNQWYNAAILELLSLADASDDPAWISTRLMPNVSPLKVTKSLALLVKLGYLVRDEAKGRLVPSEAEMTSGSEVVGLAVIRYHQQMIALAKDALTDVDGYERDVSAVTIAVRADQVEVLKEKIAEFRQDLLAFSKTSEGADEIAQLNIQLFPLARLGSQRRPK